MQSDDGGPAPTVTRRQLAIRGIAVAVVGVVGTTYLAAAIVSAGPITPLSVQLAPAANEVVQPYFVQNWQLFAPDPISEERGIVARARCEDGTTTPFVDVTSEHIDDIHETRLFPSRMSRLVSNGMFNVFLEDPYLARYREALDEPGAAQPDDGAEPVVPVPLSEGEREIRELGEHVLVSVADRGLAVHCATGTEAVQLRYMLHRFPRWSERESWRDTGEVDILETQWFSTT